MAQHSYNLRLKGADHGGIYSTGDCTSGVTPDNYTGGICDDQRPEFGATVSVTAIADYKYIVSAFLINGVQKSPASGGSDRKKHIDLVIYDTSITQVVVEPVFALYEAPVSYDLMIYGETGGTTTRDTCSVTGNSTINPCVQTPIFGDTIVVIATPEANYSLESFSVVGTGIPSNSTTTGPIDFDTTTSGSTKSITFINSRHYSKVEVLANYKAFPLTISLDVDVDGKTNPRGKIRLSDPVIPTQLDPDGDRYSHAYREIIITDPTPYSQIIVMAKPEDDGWQVKDFIVDDVVIPITDSTVSKVLATRIKYITLPIAGLVSKKVEARFEESVCAQDYTLSFSASGLGDFSIVSGDTHCEDSVVSIEAIPATGWSFLRWEIPGGQDFNVLGNTLDVIMTGNKINGIVAKFVQIKYGLNGGGEADTVGTSGVPILNETSSLFYCPSETYKDNIVSFSFTNNTIDPSNDDRYHFRVNFYSDVNKSKLVYSAFSLSNNKRWFLKDDYFSQLSSDGLSVGLSDTVSIVYDPEFLPAQITNSQKPHIANSGIVYEKPLVCGVKYYVEVQAYEASNNTIVNIETIPLILSCDRVDSYYWDYNKDNNNWLCSGQGKTDLKVAGGFSQSINPDISSNIFGAFNLVWQGRKVITSPSGALEKVNNIYGAVWSSNEDILFSSGQGLYDSLCLEGVNSPKTLTDSGSNFYVYGSNADVIKYKICPLDTPKASEPLPPEVSGFDRFCYPGESKLLGSSYDNIKVRIHEEDTSGSLVINDGKAVSVVNKKSIRLDVDGISGAYAVRVRNMEDSDWGGWINIDNDLRYESGVDKSPEDEEHDAYRIDNSRFLVQWNMEGNNGLNRVCCQVLTMYGISNVFCVEVLVNIDVPQHSFKFYVADSRTKDDEFPKAQGQYVLSLKAPGLAVDSVSNTATVYFDAIFSEPIYSDDDKRTIYTTDNTLFNFVQQGVNDQRNVKFDNITETTFSGKLTIHENDGVFNKDGDAFIEIVLSGASVDPCSSDKRDEYNYINADEAEVSNIDLLPEEIYKNYQRGRLSKALDINEFRQNYDKDDTNFKFGNQGHYRK